MRRFEVGRDAVRACEIRTLTSPRLRVADRANYVALPSVAARGVGERRRNSPG